MVTEETPSIIAQVPPSAEPSEPAEPYDPYEPASEPADNQWEPAEAAEPEPADPEPAEPEPAAVAPRPRKARGTGSARKRATRATKKAAANKRTRKKAAPARDAREGSGSPHLADSLTGLLNDVTAEVATVSALSAAIDEAARVLQSQLGEYAERIGTLSRLRQSVSGGTLAAFLDETLVPDPPAELESLTEAIQVAQGATI